MNLPYISPDAEHLADDPYSRWQRAIDAGRIAVTPVPPEVLERALATDAQFRGYARDRRRLEAQMAERDRYYRELGARGPW